MKSFYTVVCKHIHSIIITLLLICCSNVYSQRATVAMPVAIGSPCGLTGYSNTLNDSMKYFNYNATSNVLSTRQLCKPILSSPPGWNGSTAFAGFNDIFASVTFNSYDGYLYYMPINPSGVYNSYVYRWLPTTCPNPGPLASIRTFYNQFVAGVEFDPATGLGYQINFVDTTGWAPAAIDAPNNVGQFASHAVINGNPAVAYYDATSGDLRYIRAYEANGISWGTPITVAALNNVGAFASLATVNGNPAISYYDATNGDLMYVRATNADGTAWGTPVIVHATGTVGQYTSLQIVNGNPAIAYYDVINGDLRYVRATNADGTAWGASIGLDVANNVGLFATLKIVNGNPAVAYYNATNGDLRYIRATNVNGTVWAAPVTIDAANTVGQYPSMQIINGNPAIAYYDATNFDLRYVRATDASGTAWAAPLAVQTANNIGQYPSLLTVNGNAAIAYYDVTNGDLRYIRATDANGVTWGTALTVEATSNVGQYASMIIVNGRPAVAYYNSSAGDLRYVRANDVNGDMWYKTTGIYNMELQRVNFTTGALGLSYPINFGTRKIYKQQGDMVMTPGGNLLGIYDNKYFKLNWQDYGTATPLVATFIDTLSALTSAEGLVGLSYSDGKLVGAISHSTSCSSSYKELDILTGTIFPASYIPGAPANIFKSSDMTNIAAGIGAAKRLVTLTNVAGNTYDVVYEVIIKNYGNTPVNNVQAFDTLSKINGAANVVSASISSFSAPAGITANALFDGVTAGNTNLLTPGGTLSNIPGQNTITLRISCRLNNILSGIVYNNQVITTGTSLFGDALRDSSTNGAQPDLNQNDKPDDFGEGQPTPLLIAIEPQTPPCSALTNTIYAQNFGAGTGLTTAIPTPVVNGAFFPTGTTGYSGSVTQPIDIDTYTLTDVAQNANTADFLPLTDHTGNPNGRMLVINADAANSNLYRARFITSLCANQQYSLSFYAAFIGNSVYKTICDAFGGFKYPRIKMRVLDGTTGLIISEVSTDTIKNLGWQQYGFKFVTPTSFTNIIIELKNDAPGGCGNDLALDDIEFGTCDALPTISVGAVTAGCIGSSTTFNSAIGDPGALPGTKDYQWQWSPAPGTGPWTNIGGVTSSSTLTLSPITATDTGRYYRVIVAATGNIPNTFCRYISPGVQLTGKVPSVSPGAVTRNKNNICPGISVNLGITGGTLGTNASWRWYDLATNTLQGTGASLTVTPSVTTTYYVRAEGDCNTTADMPITVTINCDIDKDNDGIPDFVESSMAASFADANGNGIINAYDPAYAGYVDNNNDFINDNFQADGDSDNDGIANYADATFPGRVDANADGIDDRFDTDLDGKINMLDLDSDNDGITDVAEAYGADTNGDGIIDNYSDTDGDGLSQNVDVNNTGAYNTGLGLGNIDLDNDGIPNFLDLDSDADGIPDVVESGGPDANNNGRIDGFVDVNNDGLHDSYINGTALLITGADVTSDGKADSYPNKNLDRDFRPNAYDLDADGDGIVDVIEAGLTDANFDGRADGALTNGWSTTVSGLPALTLTNTEAIGNPDYLDIDSDGDGIPDNIEGQPTASYKLPVTTDTDGDGLVNIYDNIVGFGGAGIFVWDQDGDGIPDYIDLNTDGDSQPDIVEGNDFNLNGIADDNVTPTGIDTDGDGLDNRFDSLNSVTNIKGTSFNMGTNGVTAGDPAPGTRSPVQKQSALQIDRDWRYVGRILPVQFLNFTGALQGTAATLSWTIVTEKDIDYFEVERSTDNSNYTTAGTVNKPVALNTPQTLAYVDDVSSISTDIIYYRLKVTGKNGEFKYSNVLVLRRSQLKTAVTVMPNPAKEFASIRFFVQKEGVVEVRLIDNNGKVVLQQKQKVTRGNNTLQLNELNKYSNGVYTLQIAINDEVVSQKLIINK
jgi:hypothetical protein